MDIYFCDSCSARVTDADLHRGHGIKKSDVVVCGKCIEMGHGSDLLPAATATVTPSPAEPSAVTPAPTPELEDEAAAAEATVAEPVPEIISVEAGDTDSQDYREHVLDEQTDSKSDPLIPPTIDGESMADESAADDEEPNAETDMLRRQQDSDDLVSAASGFAALHGRQTDSDEDLAELAELGHVDALVDEPQAAAETAAPKAPTTADEDLEDDFAEDDFAEDDQDWADDLSDGADGEQHHVETAAIDRYPEDDEDEDEDSDDAADSADSGSPGDKPKKRRRRKRKTGGGGGGGGRRLIDTSKNAPDKKSSKKRSVSPSQRSSTSSVRSKSSSSSRTGASKGVKSDRLGKKTKGSSRRGAAVKKNNMPLILGSIISCLVILVVTALVVVQTKGSPERPQRDLHPIEQMRIEVEKAKDLLISAQQGGNNNDLSKLQAAQQQWRRAQSLVHKLTDNPPEGYGDQELQNELRTLGYYDAQGQSQNVRNRIGILKNQGN